MSRWFSSIHPAILIVLLGSTAAVAADEQPSLHGQVQRNSARVQRPDIRSGRDAPAPVSVGAHINDSNFSKLPTSSAAAALDAQADTQMSDEPLPVQLDSGTHSDKLDSKQTAATPAIPASKPVENTYTASGTPIAVTKKSATGKSITIRLKRFRSLQEMEVVWEALNLALKMENKGGDVTMLLDMEAVNAANRHNTMFTEFQEHRGQAEERLVTVPALMRQFIDSGGRVLASDRWAHLFYTAQGSSLVEGVKLVSDDEIADHLLDTGNILDY